MHTLEKNKDGSNQLGFRKTYESGYMPTGNCAVCGALLSSQEILELIRLEKLAK